MAFVYSLASYARRPASRPASCFTFAAAIAVLAMHRPASSHFIRLTIPSIPENEHFGRNDGDRHPISQIDVSGKAHQISLLEAPHHFSLPPAPAAHANLSLF